MSEMLTTWDGSIGRSFSECGAFCPWLPSTWAHTRKSELVIDPRQRPHKRPRRRSERTIRALLLEVLDDTPRTSVELANLVNASVMLAANALLLMTGAGEAQRTHTDRKKRQPMFRYRRGPQAPVRAQEAA